MEWKKDPRVQLLQELVEINSGTHNLKGVSQVQARVEVELKTLGFDVSWISHPGQAQSPFLVAEWVAPGTRKSQAQRNWVNLVTHADTVFEPDSGFLEFKLDESKGVATGPGVIDDKGGIVIALEGLRRFLAKHRTTAKTSPSLLPNLRWISSSCEEIGSPGFAPFLKQLGDQSRLVLGFEPSLEDGSIIESRKGNRWYQIDVFGKAGHAGRDYHQTVNAAHELAHKLVHLHQMAQAIPGVTFSTGAIQGGSKYNIVCEHACAKVDVRFSDFGAFRPQHCLGLYFVDRDISSIEYLFE